MISSTFRLVGESKPLPTYNLIFNSDEALDEFTIRFAEYYLNSQQESQWSMQVDESNKKVILTYKDSLDGLLALQKAKEDIAQAFPELISKKSNRNRFFINSKAMENGNASSNYLIAWNL